VTAPPQRIELPDAVLRPFAVTDADALARAVRESLEHLKPWMPWADNGSADALFQRRRLQGVVEQFTRGEEYQYGLFDLTETRVLGSFGLMTRRGRGTLEIGYWVHVDATGRGHATRATAVLTDVALQVPRVRHVLIYTDVANLRSAAIPRRLGYELLRVEAAPRSAPSETGRQHVWQRSEPIGEYADRNPTDAMPAADTETRRRGS
jgi:RimJ/RimL family protein N-acetyltransferase